jgi:agmatinase
MSPNPTTPPSFDPDAPATGSGVYGLPHGPDDARVVLIPVPWDATTSYRAGTSKGPAAILAASAQVDLYDVETGSPYEAGIAMLDELPEVRSWNEEARAAAERVIAVGGQTAGDPDLEQALATCNRLGEKLNDWVRAETDKWLAADKIVGVVGGDHSVPFGAIDAIAARHPQVGILHLDAHADLRNAYEGFTFSHASIMYNVSTRIPKVGRIVQVGIRDLGLGERRFIESSGTRIVTFFDAEQKARGFAGETWDECCKEIVGALPREVYLSFDIDGLDPALCPHTGTPVPGGLSFNQATHLLSSVVRGGRRIVGFDLNEVAPGPQREGESDEWDANVGARLLYKMIGWTLRSQGIA